ncbi:MAG TPA: carboxypeptidase-like regulatory domain-containing protein [Candidatus Dormibacteraeota bacterium]|nr:carboxypeptidase-like regulatory domain-containing protein [Candidatus Dormibacteraeota bacterium]
MRNKLFLAIVLFSTSSAALAFCIVAYAIIYPQSVLAAQRHTGHATLTGTVIGPDDKPISHALVTYQSSAGMKVHIVHADSQGRFRISKLKTDNYEVRADSKGLFSEWMHNVQVSAGRERTLNLRLEYTKAPLKQHSTKAKAAAKPASSRSDTRGSR